MEQLYSEIITQLGEDVNREGLRDTPKRASEAMKFLTNGYHQSMDDIINGAVFESEMDEMVIVQDIESFTTHHGTFQ